LPAGLTGERPKDYDRRRRIVKTDDFSSVFRLRPAYKSASFVLYVRPNNLEHARLGVVVAKRLAPRAVTRNAIKRITREIFRQTTLPAMDCIVRLSKPLGTRPQSASSRQQKRLIYGEVSELFYSQLTNLKS
jgi:ribonuclease P protein component